MPIKYSIPNVLDLCKELKNFTSLYVVTLTVWMYFEIDSKYTFFSFTLKKSHAKACIAVANPGFPRGGGVNPRGGANIRFCQISPKAA